MEKRTLVAVAALAWLECGCGILGPSCTDRREEGTVAMVGGAVDAGALAVHDFAYATEGSQNDVRIAWEGQGLADGPRLQFFATRAGCRDFLPPPAENAGDCTVLARGGWFDGHVASSLILTHGRGNPEILGRPPAYRVWVAGDALRPTRYTMTITYFYGPDC